eukprot:scaffold19220_cov23-Cyclotella_meneghiniana.AAC.1
MRCQRRDELKTASASNVRGDQFIQSESSLYYLRLAFYSVACLNVKSREMQGDKDDATVD